MYPAWLHALCLVSLLLGGGCALFVALDVAKRPQKMGVMNVVWPVAMLFGGIVVLWFYLTFGRQPVPPKGQDNRPASDSTEPDQPFPAIVAKGALHCGAGCTIGDVLAEWLAFIVPGIATCFGWHTLFAQKIFAVWVLDFALAFVLGIAFQYFAIAPMRQLSLGRGLMAALKADTLSLVSWQVGMYGVMALVQWLWFERSYGMHASVDTPEFWFAMQIAMLAGLATAFPVNWWLIRTGVKEPM